MVDIKGTGFYTDHKICLLNEILEVGLQGLLQLEVEVGGRFVSLAH